MVTGPTAQPSMDKALRRNYRLRAAVPGAKSLEVTFPYQVVEREARQKGLTVPEFIKHYQAVAHYDAFDGVMYTFEEIRNGELESEGTEKVSVPG